MKDLDWILFTFLEERKTDALFSILSSHKFYFSQWISVMTQTENIAIRTVKGKILPEELESTGLLIGRFRLKDPPSTGKLKYFTRKFSSHSSKLNS